MAPQPPPRRFLAGTAFFVAFTSALFATAVGPARAQQPIPGQTPLIVVGETFQWLPGTWAAYHLVDKATDEKSWMYFAVLDRETKNKTSGVWIEIEVRIPGSPHVVTRVLAEETPQGPGDLLAAIVQVEGMSPFNVPGNLLKEDAKTGARDVGQFRQAREVRRVRQHTLTRRGRALNVWDVEALDADGKPVKAIVSLELPPIGVVTADTGAILMDLDDWGNGATTRIKGHAMPLWLWVIGQTVKGANEGGKK
jgi:hypothetical protein